MRDNHEIETDAPQGAGAAAALVCILLIGFAAFGIFLTMQMGLLKAYFLASLLSSAGVFLPLAVEIIRGWGARTAGLRGLARRQT